jgi:hypothetical protein
LRSLVACENRIKPAAGSLDVAKPVPGPIDLAAVCLALLEGQQSPISASASRLRTLSNGSGPLEITRQRASYAVVFVDRRRILRESDFWRLLTEEYLSPPDTKLGGRN